MGEGREVRIAHKTQGGLVRVRYYLSEGRITGLEISGDFFFYPEKKLIELERTLEGNRIETVEHEIVHFYESQGIDSPGLTPVELAGIISGEFVADDIMLNKREK